MATLEALVRQEKKKNKVKKLRAEGMIPAILYGLKKEAISLSLKRSEVLKVYKTEFGTNVIIDLNITDGTKNNKEQVLTYNLEVDAITNSIKHIDFIRVDENTKVKAHIPIKLIGSAPGLKMGGVLIQKTDSLYVHCVPSKILTEIEVNMSEQEVGDFIRVRDLDLGEIIILTNPDETIVRIASPRTQVEEEEEGAEAAEAGAEAPKAEEGDTKGDDAK
ncbi:50S ribosomal protein L25 [Candidatus Marinamargulisbacteria bacterium SCGC AAA071-K20]|nr:50S ribosomal protein L25 [Candidatus Marinamargulisbacteria bacterium SCGC AAA071-K20]